MCVVSMVSDHYLDKWRELQPQSFPQSPWVITTTPAISPEEVAEFRRLLERAREYDRRNGEPECELETKKQALKALAKELGVEIDFL